MSLPPFWKTITEASLSNRHPSIKVMSVPVEPPPDYEYAVSHPTTVLPPGYQVAAILPSYQQAELDKGKMYMYMMITH